MFPAEKAVDSWLRRFVASTPVNPVEVVVEVAPKRVTDVASR
jgi:hypothetical protein